MKESTRIKQEIQETFQHYSKMLDIQRSIELVFSPNKNFNGQYFNNVVTLNQPIIENWDNERKVCEFLLVHELVHAKYNDHLSFIGGIRSAFSPSISVKLAFRELRANIIAYEITGIDELDLENYFSNYYIYSIIPFSAMTGGYLKGHEYLEFIRQHPTWTKETIRDVSYYLKRYSLWYGCVSKSYYLKLQQECTF